MAFKKTYYYTRLNDFGEVTGADVGIHDPETGENLQARLKGNHTQASDTELIQAVLDDFYKRHYVDKAMAEAVQTVDMLERQSKAFAKAIEDAKSEIKTIKEETLAEIKSVTEQNQEMIKLSTLTLNDALMQIEELLENLEEKNDETIGTTEEIDRGGTTDE